MEDNERIINNIKIHFEYCCSDEMRLHGYISHDHDIDFQVFRALCGYGELLNEYNKLLDSVRGFRREQLDYIGDDRNEGARYREALKVVDELIKE